MAEIKVYRNYDHYRDPVMDEVKDFAEKEHLANKLGILSEISGLSRTTLDNWFNGTTKRPQYATVMAVMGSLGYAQKGFRKVHMFDLEAARKDAKRWRMMQENKKKAAKAKLMARRRAAREAAMHSGR